MSDSFPPHGLQPTRFHGILQAKNTRVSCHFFSRGIFLAQGLKTCLWRLLHWQADSFTLRHLREASHPEGFCNWTLPKTFDPNLASVLQSFQQVSGSLWWWKVTPELPDSFQFLLQSFSPHHAHTILLILFSKTFTNSPLHWCCSGLLSWLSAKKNQNPASDFFWYTESPHMNLQVANFQRCKHAFAHPVTCYFTHPAHTVTDTHPLQWLRFRALHCTHSGKESTSRGGSCRRLGLNPRSGRSPGGGDGNPLLNSGLENSMDRETWRATVLRVAKSWTLLNDWACTHTHTHTHTHTVYRVH